jgi:hypothetical protein
MPNPHRPANDNAWPKDLADIVAILRAAERIAAERDAAANDCEARLGTVAFLVEQCRLGLSGIADRSPGALLD